MAEERRFVSESKRKYVEYGVRVRGVWGRNRSVKSDSFKVLESEAARPVEEIRPLVEAKLREIKVKPGARFAAYEGEREESVRSYSDGTSMRSVCFALFGDKKLYEGAVE
jgi:hypothetical protein